MAKKFTKKGFAAMVTLEIQDIVKKAGSKKLYKDCRVEFKHGKHELKLIVPYEFTFFDKGRGKNKTPPPFKAIKKWLKDTGDYDNDSQVWAISKSIGKKGFKGHNVMASIIKVIVKRNKEWIIQEMKEEFNKPINKK